MAVVQYPGARTGKAMNGVRVRHPEYLDAADGWHRTQCMLGGADGIKRNANDLVPMLPSHYDDPTARSGYIQRIQVYGAAARTLDALAGAIFRKDPTLQVPPRYSPRLENLNGAGDKAVGFAQKVVREVLAYGRCGLLIDAPSAGTADVRDPLAALPYVVSYDATNIINWRTQFVGGRRVLQQVVIEENVDDPAEFGVVRRVRHRVHELDADGLYVIRTFISDASGDAMEIDRVEPTGLTQNKRLDFVPFVFISPLDLSPQVQRAPLLDLVDTNLSHVRVAADWGNALYKLGAPTVIVAGMPEEARPAEFKLGGAMYLPEGASCTMLEYTGDGLGALERGLDRLEAQMAHLGARLLEVPRRGVEAAETVRLRQSSETSVLAAVARNVSDGIKGALELACRWVNIPGRVAFELNQDFIDVSMDPSMLAELIKAVQAGYMPVNDLYYNLRRGEMLRPDLTSEQYRAELQTDPPALMGSPMILDAIAAPARARAEPANDRLIEAPRQGRDSLPE